MQYPSLTRSHGAAHRVRADGPDPADGRAHRQHRPRRAARHRDQPRPVRPRTARPPSDSSGPRSTPAPSGSGWSTPRPRSPASPTSSSPPTATSSASIVQSLDDALVEEREERVVLAGTANLARVGTDFPLSIGPVLEALEQHVVLLKLLGTARETSDAVSVRIGHENPFAGLQSTSVVSTEYGSGSELGGRARRARADPDGLPHDDGVGAGRGHLRLPDPRAVTRVALHHRPSPPTATPVTPRTCVERLLPGPGRVPGRQPRGHQAGLPQEGTDAAPGRQPQPGGRGAVQEGLAGLRRALRRGQAPLLRHGVGPLRRRRRRLRPGLLVQRHHGRLLRRRCRSGPARPALAPAARPGRPRSGSTSTSPTRSSAPRRSSPSRPPWSAPTCHGDGAQPGHLPAHLRRLWRSRRDPAGAALLPRPGHDDPSLRDLPGLRRGPRQPVLRVLRRRPGPHPPHPQDQGARRCRHRHPHPARRRGRGRPGRRSRRRPLRRGRGPSAPDLPAPRRRPALHGRAAHDRRRPRHHRQARDLRRQQRARDQVGHPARRRDDAARPRRHPPAGHGSWRPHHPRQRADADPARRAAGGPAAPARRRCAARSAPRAGCRPPTRACSASSATPSRPSSSARPS